MSDRYAGTVAARRLKDRASCRILRRGRAQECSSDTCIAEPSDEARGTGWIDNSMKSLYFLPAN